MIKTNSKKSILIGAASVLALLLASAPAFAEDAKQFDIEEQPLAKALLAFNEQSGLTVAAPRNLVEGKTALAVHGEMEPGAALEKLLADTGLKSTELPNGAYTVTLAIAEANEARSFRVAQLGQEDAGTVETVDRNRRDEEKDEIVVTGTNIRGAAPVGSQLLTFDRASIEATGLATMPEFLETLPQNFGLVGVDGSPGGGAGLPNAFANQNGGSSLNLRGLGQGTTLTLLNGRRMALGFQGTAVDVSAIPLTAIERVEVLTDGASAIYGSDAIGGVVNFVLRDDFEGAETTFRYGRASDVDEYRAAQSLGGAWGSGHALASFQYFSRDNLASADRSFSGGADLRDLLPEDEQYSAVLAGAQDVGDAAEFFFDGYWSERNTHSEGLSLTQWVTDGKDRKLNLSGGLRFDLFSDWKLETAGSYGRSKTGLNVDAVFSGFPYEQEITSVFEVYAANAKADGSLFELPGGAARLALGGAWRHESLDIVTMQALAGVSYPATGAADEQDVYSAFFETYIPLIGENNGTALVQSLELSVAGRYDDYSTFGSSFDPKVGFSLTSFDGFTLRGSYGTSYKAPNLRDYTAALNSATASEIADPLSPLDMITILRLNGTIVDFEPQKAETWTIGFDYSPGFAEGLFLSANYYNISFKDRIAFPPSSSSTILADATAFADIITAAPAAAEVAAAIAIGELGQGFFDQTPLMNFTAADADYIIDGRQRNLGVTDTEGVDIRAGYNVETDIGRFNVDLNANYIFNLESAVTRQSSRFNELDRIFYPTDFRMRASLGYTRSAFSGGVYVNYVPSYIDDRDAENRQIDAWTTVDVRASLELEALAANAVTQGLELSLSVRNLFDEEPPAVLLWNAFDGSGYDPANADPLGRLLAIEIRKTW
ncbi:TonB-dependent receptor [Hyphococcus luteus]|uniref:Secretin/TonB short N-terminal domain-containing protein n=1 Tax=Hyphococcus luteus TaxID=2058213 RepID=A0A2S7K400_9PROT|nr:TonB-dependent receptor [Marinicaulis flavus]PQA87168.1 hypothetical protein CW354_14105 [Marinicaulis flavus]